MSNLLALLKTPEYRIHYVKYKIMVEHRQIPTKLLKDLPRKTALELRCLYEKEKENYFKKKNKTIPNR